MSFKSLLRAVAQEHEIITSHDPFDEDGEWTTVTCDTCQMLLDADQELSRLEQIIETLCHPSMNTRTQS